MGGGGSGVHLESPRLPEALPPTAAVTAFLLKSRCVQQQRQQQQQQQGRRESELWASSSSSSSSRAEESRSREHHRPTVAVERLLHRGRSVRLPASNHNPDGTITAAAL